MVKISNVNYQSQEIKDIAPREEGKYRVLNSRCFDARYKECLKNMCEGCDNCDILNED